MERELRTFRMRSFLAFILLCELTLTLRVQAWTGPRMRRPACVATTVVLTSGSSYNAPAYCRTAKVWAIGAGGGGAGSPATVSSVGGGGGAGAGGPLV